MVGSLNFVNYTYYIYKAIYLLGDWLLVIIYLVILSEILFDLHKAQSKERDHLVQATLQTALPFSPHDSEYNGMAD